MQPNLPVRDSHDDVADFKVFLLPNGAHLVLWDGWVSYRVPGYIGLILLVHITRFFSSGVKNVAVEGKSTITIQRLPDGMKP